jgi:hypothetical protein
MISLSLMIRLISEIISELTHTAVLSTVKFEGSVGKRTFFAYEGVVAIIRIVCIACSGASAVTDDSKVEL